MLIWSVPYPVCLPWRWKWEEINIGLSHHLVAHRIEVQRLVEDFDYSLALCHTRFKLFLRSLCSLSSSSHPPPAVCVVAVPYGASWLTRFGLFAISSHQSSHHTPVRRSWSPLRSSQSFERTVFTEFFLHCCRIFSPPSQSKIPRIIFRC